MSENKKKSKKKGFSLKSIAKLFAPFDAGFYGGVAVCIDNQRIRMMELSSDKNGDIRISGFSERPLDEGIVTGDIILAPEELGKEIYSCYQLGGFTSKNILMNIGGNNVTIKKIDVPKGKELDTMRFVQNESRKHIPSQQDDVMIEYYLHDNQEAQYNKADLIISKKDYVDALTQAINEAGLSLVCVEPDFFSLFNAHAINLREDAQKDADSTYYNPHISTAFVHIGLDKTIISVLSGGTIASGVSTAGGIESFDRAIMEFEHNDRLTYKELQKIRLTKNVALEYMNEFSEFLVDIHGEISSFCNFYNSNHSDKKIEAVLFTGELSGMMDVISKIAAKFMFVVKEFDIDEFSKIKWEEYDSDEDVARRFILSNYDLFGLALRGLNNVG